MADTLNNETLNNIVTANARTFHLINSDSEENRTLFIKDSEQGIDERNDVLARQLDALQPYVDSARIARQMNEHNPSIQNGSRMGEKVEVLTTRITNILKAIPMRESELWTLVRQKFPKIDEILGGLRTNG